MRELALAFIARRSPRPRSNTFRLLAAPSPLIANFHSPRRNSIANDNPTRIASASDQRESKGLSYRSLQLKPSRSRLPRPPWRLIANPELEFLASLTKLSLLTFSNRKKIAVFDPRPNLSLDEPKKLSSPLAYLDNRCRSPRAIHPLISNRNSRFTEFRSTYCKHAPYRISNRNKNAHFAFYTSQIASHASHAANRQPRTTTRAAFRSTIPARPHAHR